MQAAAVDARNGNGNGEEKKMTTSLLEFAPLKKKEKQLLEVMEGNLNSNNNNHKEGSNQRNYGIGEEEVSNRRNHEIGELEATTSLLKGEKEVEWRKARQESLIQSSIVCLACKEMLFEPVTLPCGYSICTRCFRLPKTCGGSLPLSASAIIPGGPLASTSAANSPSKLKEDRNNTPTQSQSSSSSANSSSSLPPSQPSSIVVSYKCPIKKCHRLHQYRNEKPNILLHNILSRFWPEAQRALSLNKVGEEKLSLYWNAKCSGGERNPTSGNDIDNTTIPPVRREQQEEEHQRRQSCLEGLIEDYFSPSILLAPGLQLPYITRAKANAELGNFGPAFLDAKAGHLINPLNKRGLAAEKLVEWRKFMLMQGGEVGHENAGCAFNQAVISGGVLAVDGSSQTISSPSGQPSLNTPIGALVSSSKDDIMKDMAKKLKSQVLELLDKVDSTLILPATSLSYFQSTMVLEDITLVDLECNICLANLRYPLTTPCGHSFCRSCLLEAMTQQGRTCPTCRSNLPCVGYFLKRPIDLSLRGVVAFLESLHEKEQQQQLMAQGLLMEGEDTVMEGDYIDCQQEDLKEEEEPSILLPKLIPLFICSLVFPNSTEGFHMFEPRYRAMIKSCLEGNREFGIVLPSTTGGGDGGVCCDYGTMVRIIHSEALVTADMVEVSNGEEIELLPRFIVEVKGMYRFKILSRQLNPFGYMEGMVERVEDIEPEDSVSSTGNGDWNPSLLSSLCDEARSFVRDMINFIPPTAQQHFLRKYGPMPEGDAYDLSFWLAEFLPLNPYTLYTLLPLTSCVERLQVECGWIRRSSKSRPGNTS